MSFTDQKQRIVTEQDLTAPWSGHTDGSRFYCKLCGRSFKLGDKWRWVYAGERQLVNFFVGECCDDEYALDRWAALHSEWDLLSRGKFRFMADSMRDAEYEARHS